MIYTFCASLEPVFQTHRIRTYIDISTFCIGLLAVSCWRSRLAHRSNYDHETEEGRCGGQC